MIRIDDLIGFIAKKRTSQRQLAVKIGINERTFYIKMKKGVFRSDEIDGIIAALEMTRKEALDIFFIPQDTQQVTGGEDDTDNRAGDGEIINNQTDRN